MTIKHIQDQIENYAIEVARASYLLGLEHGSDKKLPNMEDIHDLIQEIVKSKLKGD